MKAEELMVGDWVHYKMDLGKDGIYEKDIRINNIYGSEVNCELRGYEIISGKSSSNLYPIPLTPEILEGNANGGWCNYQSEPKGRSIYHIGEVAVYVEWERIVPSPYIEIHGLGDTFFKGYIDYVHQLQHALRLCGVEKEIVL